MLLALSLPMKAERSRNKQRLEASLAGLCELELLKQRQEYRVLSALYLGDSPVTGRPTWGALRSAHCVQDASKSSADYSHSFQTSRLQCMPWDIEASLEEQVAELKVNTAVRSADTPTERKGSQPSSGPEETEETEKGETWLSGTTRQTKVTDAFGNVRGVDSSQEDYQQAQKLETYIFGLIQRRALPTRPSKPRTNLTHDARAVSVVRQSSLCHKEEQCSPKEITTPSHCSEGTAPQAYHNFDREHYLLTGFTEDSPPPYHDHLQQSVKHQPGLYHRPRHACMTDDISCSTLQVCPSFRVLQTHPDSSNSDPDSPQYLYNYPSPSALSKSLQPPSSDEQLVNAEYIPAQPCQASTRAYAQSHSNPHKSSGVPKLNPNTYSSDRSYHHHHQEQPTVSQIQPSRCRGGPKKCRSTEDRSGVSRKPGKKTCRSQSENSLQRVPERKYNTVERDGGGSGCGGRGSRSSHSRSKKQQQGSGSYRRWQSTLELSQDEADQSPMQGSSAANQKVDHCGRRTRKSRLTHASYAYPHPHAHHHQQVEYLRVQVPPCQPSEEYSQPDQGESESSMSDGDSPDSSSLSSDSDESGCLVWPQQLPPQLSLPSPPATLGVPLQPKAFVKIKASHALKKKILRFHTGSLKVMTTV
uniref:dapper homolog 3-like isoform X2 n=1 Tax=Scatophagus argus TaxID=75038 RepID=UPI001ED7D39E|nr:dapper homolog 3-like isoform X2 [Scatophagus argus]